MKRLLIAGLLLTAGCAVGPDYQRPETVIPAQFKEAAGWKVAEPGQAESNAAWWSVYNDPVLDGIEREIAVSNQNLAAAEAAWRQAQAAVALAQASFWPTLGITPSGERSGRGPGQRGQKAPSVTTAGGTVIPSGGSGGTASNQFSLTGSASWSPDIWGKIRRTVESNEAAAEASADDLAALRLSTQALAATDYFELRIADAMQRLLEQAATAYRRSLEITRNQYKSGIAAKSDVAQAEAQVETTQAQAINTGVARAALEHALAVLTGKPPADFAVAPAAFAVAIPAIPVEVPSALLERRPDIAAAEQQMAQANAKIGVALAAWYPNLALNGTYGVTSATLGALMNASNNIWAFGGSLAETVFDGGARSADVAIARAAYDQTVATYRQTVLTAFSQVEDQLAALRILENQATVQARAVTAANEAERLIQNQYKAGTVAYTSVIVAQTAALTDAESNLSIQQNRLTASVALIQALGGGWHGDEAARLAAKTQ